MNPQGRLGPQPVLTAAGRGGGSTRRARRRPRDPVQSASDASLRYVTDAVPGIARARAGKGFRYIAPDGKPVRDREALSRIRSLAIPPAWTHVWISPRSDGHLQATGRDARGRKQYRYHARFRARREETKYDRLIPFGEALPAIRARVEKDLSLPGLPREKVLAIVVRLLEATLIRIGNRDYAKQNRSFGLTTMLDKHVDIHGSTLLFEFRGKSGKKHSVKLSDRRLARLVRRCQEIPGQELFQYYAEGGDRQTIDSSDVNGYLKEITGQEFTAKDYRTWAGSVLAALALREIRGSKRAAPTRKGLTRAIEQVAERLGNTPAICRKCYVHPDVPGAYEDGITIPAARHRAPREGGASTVGLMPEETALLALLRQRLGAGEAGRP